MKAIKLYLALLVINTALYGQHEMPILHTNNPLVDFEEGLIFHENGWKANPEISLDEYTPNIYDTNTTFSFYSEVDTISFTLKPNSFFDFAVVINQRDTAYTRIRTKDIVKQNVLYFENANIHSNGRDAFYLELGPDNRPHVKGKINASRELDCLFDTGAGSVVVNAYLVDTDEIDLADKKEVVLVQGSDGVDTLFKSLGNTIQVGNFRWDNIKILPINYKNRKFDAVLGWSLFEENIVELNYSKDSIIIHNKLPDYSRDYHKTRMRQIHGVHYVEISIIIDGKEHKDWFEFDTGFSKTLNVNYEYSIKHNLYEKMPTVYKDVTSGSSGIEIMVDKVILPELHIAGYELYEVPISLVSKVENGLEHNGLLGNLILKRFDTIIDYTANMLYLKPNKYIYSPVN